MFGIIHTMNLACIIFAVICDLAAIKNGNMELYRAGERFSVTGHVISTGRRPKKTITFWNNPVAIKVDAGEDMLFARQDVRYRLDGHLELLNKKAKIAVGERLVPVETNSLPVPAESSVAAIVSGRDLSGFVRINGTIVKAAEDEMDNRFCWLTLRDDGNFIAASCSKKKYPIALLRSHVGSVVRLTGAILESAPWQENLPQRLHMTNRNGLEVVAAAETNPAKLPYFTAAANPGRQRLDGVVIAKTSRGFYLRCRRHYQTSYKMIAYVIPVDGAMSPDIGNVVTVAGFTSLNAYHLCVDEALVKPAGNLVVPPASADQPSAALSISSLFTDIHGNEKIAANKHGTLVRVTGTVRDMPPASAGSRRVVMEDGGYRVGIDSELISGAPPCWIENGATIEATGILIVEYEPAPSPYALPRFMRFTIIPRSVDDLRLVRRAPWWTPRRLLAVILVLLGVIVWISLWNRALKRLSVKRGEELYRERIAHKAAELKVEERTRLAVEIHDSISQTLTGIALQFENGADEAVVRQMLASCRHELKSCLWDLRSRTFEEKDMTEAVRRAIGPNAGSAKIDVRFNVPRSELSETTTHAILRIVRELVVNAVRHGKATEVKVAGECHDGTISFSVKDNGSGFDPANVAGPPTGHFGLQGIRERLNNLHGEMKVTSSPGSGTHVVVKISPRISPDETTQAK